MGMSVRFLLFDFGGTLDSDGIHSRTLFLNSFLKNRVLVETQTLQFQEAYSAADDHLQKTGTGVKLNLRSFNSKMVELILENMKIPHKDKNKISDDITLEQNHYLLRNNKILTQLKTSYELGIVSNFTGNLELILAECDCLNLFNFVLDSYHVGFSKPDLRIFQIALKKTNQKAENVLFVGDNLERDILPAKTLGMKTCWLIRHGTKNSSGHRPSDIDLKITSLLDLPLVMSQAT